MHNIFDRAFTKNSQLIVKKKRTTDFKRKGNQDEHFGTVNQGIIESGFGCKGP